MDFELSDAQAERRAAARDLGAGLAPEAPAAEVVALAAARGLTDAGADLFGVAVAVEALAEASASAAVTLALHASVAPGLGSHGSGTTVGQGAIVAAITLSSEDLPDVREAGVWGRVSWVAPLTAHGIAVVGVRDGGGVTAAVVPLDGPGVAQDPVEVSALGGLVCGHLRLEGAPHDPVGPVQPFMARVRILLAAAGLGMGRRALREALEAARGRTGHGAGGEQTVQGLLADTATELDAARMLTWKAASAAEPSLVEASMAKLAVTDATQRAVARATQVVGADSFRTGHVVERLARDVRVLELFAGRTEALREAVALGTLPQV